MKRVLPDAFTLRDPAVGEPTIVLTAKGEVIQAGWVKTVAGQSIAKTLQEQLVPGVETSYFGGVTVTDESGTRANVSLAWESPKEAPTR